MTERGQVDQCSVGTSADRRFNQEIRSGKQAGLRRQRLGVCAFTLWAWLAPDAAQKAIFGAMDWVASNLGWYYILTPGIIVIFVIFVIAIAISRVGKTRLGPDHSRPQYSVFTWASVLFSAGIGVDVTFFAISGPATNFLPPPEAQPQSDEAARMATIWTMFHYGIPG